MLSCSAISSLVLILLHILKGTYTHRLDTNKALQSFEDCYVEIVLLEISSSREFSQSHNLVHLKFPHVRTSYSYSFHPKGPLICNDQKRFQPVKGNRSHPSSDYLPKQLCFLRTIIDPEPCIEWRTMKNNMFHGPNVTFTRSVFPDSFFGGFPLNGYSQFVYFAHIRISMNSETVSYGRNDLAVFVKFSFPHMKSTLTNFDPTVLILVYNESSLPQDHQLELRSAYLVSQTNTADSLLRIYMRLRRNPFLIIRGHYEFQKEWRMYAKYSRLPHLKLIQMNNFKTFSSHKDLLDFIPLSQRFELLIPHKTPNLEVKYDPLDKHNEKEIFLDKLVKTLLPNVSTTSIESWMVAEDSTLQLLPSLWLETRSEPLGVSFVMPDQIQFVSCIRKDSSYLGGIALFDQYIFVLLLIAFIFLYIVIFRSYGTVIPWRVTFPFHLLLEQQITDIPIAKFHFGFWLIACVFLSASYRCTTMNAVFKQAPSPPLDTLPELISKNFTFYSPSSGLRLILAMLPMRDHNKYQNRYMIKTLNVRRSAYWFQLDLLRWHYDTNRTGNLAFIWALQNDYSSLKLLKSFLILRKEM